MNSFNEVLVRTLVIGAGATAAMDIWRFSLQRAFGVTSLDLGLLGRWAGHLLRGRFFHDAIGKSPKIRGEVALGWISHYAIGIAFAALIPFLWGTDWLRSPSFLPALAVGIATVLAPWFIMQPAMGLGLAANHAPAPHAVRLRNLAIHTVYGLGLYASAILVGKL